MWSDFFYLFHFLGFGANAFNSFTWKYTCTAITGFYLYTWDIGQRADSLKVSRGF